MNMDVKMKQSSAPFAVSVPVLFKCVILLVRTRSDAFNIFSPNVPNLSMSKELNSSIVCGSKLLSLSSSVIKKIFVGSVNVYIDVRNTNNDDTVSNDDNYYDSDTSMARISK